jgi:hypothetical protein
MGFFELAAGGVFNNPHAISANDLKLSGGPKDLGAGIAIITQDLMILIGSLSIIFIIVGGLQFVLSGGDSKRVETAKNTILYAVVGLVIAISAYAIVSFITGAGL